MTSFIKNTEERIVGGIVYAPDVPDQQGDYTTTAEIWKAMKTFAENGFPLGVMHSGKAKAHVVECFQAEKDTKKGGDVIPAGAWYMAAKVDDDELWEAIKLGRMTGWSMSGQAESTNE